MTMTISVTGGKGPYHNTKNALEKVDLSVIKGKSVLVKPNMGRLVGPGRGINTHPDAVAAVVEAVIDSGAAKVSIGESPIVGVNVMEAFRLSGLDYIAEKYGCTLLDLDDGKPVVVDIPKGEVLEQTKICGAVMEHDIIISVPVAKCHMHTGVTLGIKNMKGCLYKREKIRYHQIELPSGFETDEKTLDLAISDLAKALLPDFTVIDGYIGLEGLGPSGGEPRLSDFALASDDPVGADIIGCALMGKRAESVPHIKLTAQYRDVSVNGEDYEVVPGHYADFASLYKDPPLDISVEYPDVVLVDKESCSACLSTVMLFLKRFKTSMDQYLPEGERLCLAIGKGVSEENVPKGAVLVGNCAKIDSEDYIFVKGCPPVATRIYQSITGEEPDDNEPDVK